MGSPTQLMGNNKSFRPNGLLPNGVFYFFLRDTGPMFDVPVVGTVALGHMGWAFKFNSSGSHYMGSLENLGPGFGAVRVGPGESNASYWYTARSGGRDSVMREFATCQTAEERFGFAKRQRESGRPHDPANHITAYHQWKAIYIRTGFPQKALKEAQRWSGTSLFGTSYSVIAQNCLDNAVGVASAYGIMGMPDRGWHPAPFSFFNALRCDEQGQVPFM
ncbi:MAG TPA: hypothetical protein VLS89_08285 [Candidatus Nanopelagicales bacterium]|nr:hypothetical protein [Candidatus Nanopelagicales bacterium]